jgi:hypothetical protein
LLEKGDRVGYCFLIEYVSGITHVSISLSVGRTPFLLRANNFDAGTLILFMWSYRSLATVYASNTAEMFSLDGGDDYYYYDDDDDDDDDDDRFCGLKDL